MAVRRGSGACDPTPTKDCPVATDCHHDWPRRLNRGVLGCVGMLTMERRSAVQHGNPAAPRGSSFR